MAELVDNGESRQAHDPDADASRVEVAQSAEGPDTVVLTVTGELDLGSESLLRQPAEQAVAAGAKSIVFELSGLTFMDSSGIGLLLMVAAQVAEIEIRNPSAAVRRVIELSGLADTLRITQ